MSFTPASAQGRKSITVAASAGIVLILNLLAAIF
jgi:hypothetical protein